MSRPVDPAIEAAVRELEELVDVARKTAALLRANIDLFRRMGNSIPAGPDRDRILSVWFKLDQLTLALEEIA